MAGIEGAQGSREKGRVSRLPVRACLTALLVLSLVPFKAAGGKGQSRKYLGKYRVTMYWVVKERDVRYRNAPGRVPILDPHGRVIKWVSKLFKQDLDMEGTGWLRDGRTVNYHSRAGGTTRFIITREKYGLAADGKALVPFRSVSADRARIPKGAMLYIPSLKGFRLPGGKSHTGVVIAHDTGKAIKGRKLDLFIGTRAMIGKVERTGVTRGQGVKVYWLDPPVRGGRGR